MAKKKTPIKHNWKLKLLLSLGLALLLTIALNLKKSYEELNWEVFRHKQYGFEIKYPKGLNLTPREIDQKQEYKSYVDKCNSGEIDGCGGSRWPDFLIEFNTNDGNTFFSVAIHQTPVKQYGLAEFENNSFSYNIYSFNKNKMIFNKIKDTFRFIDTEKPLKCLWSTEMDYGFDPIKDLEYINENLENLLKVSGFYFESNETKKCVPIQFYTWKEQAGFDLPPFTTYEECVKSCSN